MSKQKKTVTVMVLDEQRTETFVMSAGRLKAIKPALVGLSFVSGILFTGLLALGWQHYQSYDRLAVHERENVRLSRQIEDLKQARSEEITARLAQLAQSEQAVQHLQQYLQQRGVKVELPDIPVAQPGKGTAQAGGPEIVLPSADTPEFKQALDRLLQAAETVPLGRPAAGSISSGFGPRPNPFSGRGSEFHNGLDFRGSIGDPIIATANGKVEFAGTMNGYGQVVRLRHGHGYSTVYGHLSAIDVRVGQQIEAGDLVGKLGSTGRSTGPHLHYEVRLNDEPLDPAGFLSLAAR